MSHRKNVVEVVGSQYWWHRFTIDIYCQMETNVELNHWPNSFEPTLWTVLNFISFKFVSKYTIFFHLSHSDCLFHFIMWFIFSFFSDLVEISLSFKVSFLCRSFHKLNFSVYTSTSQVEILQSRCKNHKQVVFFLFSVMTTDKLPNDVKFVDSTMQKFCKQPFNK